MIKIFNSDNDLVLNSTYYTGVMTYQNAIDYLIPIMSNFEYQRKLQNEKFYERLRSDLLNGCIMPPITIAFVDPNAIQLGIEDYIKQNIGKGYILDGLQRLNALNTIKDSNNFPKDKLIYLNIIISKTQDKLLYRMITLNNGQKPMTPRHQIETLFRNSFDFNVLKNIEITTELKYVSRIHKTTFQFSSITKAYLAFLTNNVNNENSKIISEEMDKIIVNRIMENGVPDDKTPFYSILSCIDEKCVNPEIYDWFKVENNLIGFAAGISEYFDIFEGMQDADIVECLNKFEEAFKILNVSKIKLGQTRRELVQVYFKKFEKLCNLSLDDLKEFIITEKD